MFEKSVLTTSDWRQLRHPDTQPDKGRDHNNKRECWKGAEIRGGVER